MLDFEKIREKERRLRQRKAKIESDLSRLQTQQKKSARKDDTRKKIVLGGTLLAAVDAGDVTSDFIARLVSAHVAERDKKLFAGTAFAMPEMTGSAAPDSDSGA